MMELVSGNSGEGGSGTALKSLNFDDDEPDSIALSLDSKINSSIEISAGANNIRVKVLGTVVLMILVSYRRIGLCVWWPVSVFSSVCFVKSLDDCLCVVLCCVHTTCGVVHAWLARCGTVVRVVWCVTGEGVVQRHGSGRWWARQRRGIQPSRQGSKDALLVRLALKQNTYLLFVCVLRLLTN